ncbi:BnaA05g17530D [Brassica napus]|uniref:BnaA05g17530D protein n=1 Tax=Brassica napus TaxID=3708 RepID=A0A078GE89_BRANA|nr:BnaA05g17530D [Brassica napus]
MASIIGLCLRAKLKECLPLHYQVNYALNVSRLGNCIGES